MSGRVDHPVYFLTWTTYGTWLHGDERGSVDRQHNQAGTPFLAPDPVRQCRARSQQKSETVQFSIAQRRIVENTIREVAEFRGWTILAVNCRSNHVHVVVLARDHLPERVMNDFKSWSSRRLNESALTPRLQWWTRHGSTRYLNDPHSIARAVEYVVEAQDRKHRDRDETE